MTMSMRAPAPWHRILDAGTCQERTRSFTPRLGLPGHGWDMEVVLVGVTSLLFCNLFARR